MAGTVWWGGGTVGTIVFELIYWKLFYGGNIEDLDGRGMAGGESVSIMQE